MEGNKLIYWEFMRDAGIRVFNATVRYARCVCVNMAGTDFRSCCSGTMGCASHHMEGNDDELLHVIL